MKQTFYNAHLNLLLKKNQIFLLISDLKSIIKKLTNSI